MPRYARPVRGKLVEAAIEAFGNRVRVAILRHLREAGPSTRGELSAALGVAAPTIYNHLSGLRDAGVIEPDPPAEEAKSGQRVRWSVKEARVAALYRELGRELGQDPDATSR